MTEQSFNYDARRRELQRSVGTFSLIGGWIYFNRNNVRLPLDAQHCHACESWACDHLAVAALLRWRASKETRKEAA